MEGLEVSVVPLSAINSEFRVEAEFFWKRYLHEATALSKLPQQTLGEVAFITDGPHGYHVVDESSPVIMLTAKNAKDWFSDRDAADHLALFVHEASQRSSLAENDVILSTRGTVGLCALVTSEVLPANIDQDVARISFKPGVQFIPGFVIAYLNSSFGQDYMKRFASGMVQQGLSLQKVRDIPVPVLSGDFQNQVAHTVANALAKRREATNCQAQAEQNLLRALGLEGWEPPEPLTYTRRASEVLGAARFDAEHFRPKFAALLAAMRKHGKVVRFGDCVRFCERGRQPQYAEEGLPVINSRHVRANSVVLDDDNRFATEDAAQLKLDEDDRFTIRQGDLLINGTGVGTMGRCAPYLREERALPDNHVTILRMKPEAGLEPVFLSVQLNSIIGQMQVEQYFKGSSGQIELYPGEIKEFRIWLAPAEIQQQIKAHLEQAYKSRQQAQALLAKARRAVEVAIEEGQARAFEHLRS